MSENKNNVTPDLNKKEKEKKMGLQHWQVLALLMAAYDVLVSNGAYLFGLWARFDFHFSEIDPKYLDAALRFVPIYSGVVLIVFASYYLYQSIWRFASYRELIRLLGQMPSPSLHS